MQSRAAFFLLATAPAVTSSIAAHDAVLSKYTYYKDVRPIFVKQCGSCHAPGKVGPMSLLRYEEASPWAESVKREVLEGRMPPWLPEEGVSDFVGARSLSAKEIDVIVDWATGAAPEGPEDAAPTPVPSDEKTSALGTPDLILEPPGDVLLGVDEVEKQACWVLAVGSGKARAISAIDFQPGNPEVVRSARLSLAASCTEAEVAPPIWIWTPGASPYVLRVGMGIPLRRPSKIALQVKYKKTWRDDGKETRDRSRVALYFTDARKRVEFLRLDRSPLVLGYDVEVLAVYPLLRSREPSAQRVGGSPEPIATGVGSPSQAGNDAPTHQEDSVRVDAIRRDGSRVPLLSIDEQDPAWDMKLVLRTPVTLERGDRIEATRPGVLIDYVRR